MVLEPNINGRLIIENVKKILLCELNATPQRMSNTANMRVQSNLETAVLSFIKKSLL